MNLFTPEGDIIRCVTFDAGYKWDREIAKQHLSIGYFYTVEQIFIHNWERKVCLKEFPGVYFNTVFFENVNNEAIDKYVKEVRSSIDTESGKGGNGPNN